ncbi:MAG TPA: ABC transporter ATP-binding protein [Spirochaetales bacterium]|nr:ABC transporter ATP-binding protein [Spirochaetales bacterium]
MHDFTLHNISKSFGNLEVLHSVSASFPEASVTAVLGPSGAGKTTLLNIVSGLLTPDTGTIGDFASATFSYAFQEPRLLPWLDVEENLRFALSSLHDKPKAETRAQMFLKEAGLEEFRYSFPAQLSGGMRQKASLVRAFAFPSDVLLLDEALSAVDIKVRIELLDLFARLWQEEKRTTIFVSHDLHDALYIADQVILLSARPATVMDSITIEIPRELRSYDADQLKDVERRLYREILASS